MRTTGSLVSTWWVWIALGALGSAGCHEHVQLRAPTADASQEEREDSYESLRPVSMHETHVTYLQGGVPVGAERQTDYLQLQNGTRVYYPEDLKPVVSENSPAWLAAGESQSARSTANTLLGTGIAAYVGGGTLMLVPPLTFDASDPNASMNMTPLYIGAGVMLAGVVCHLVSRSFRSTANDEAATAFETYDAGLRERLDLKAAKARRRPRPAVESEE